VRTKNEGASRFKASRVFGTVLRNLLHYKRNPDAFDVAISDYLDLFKVLAVLIFVGTLPLQLLCCFVYFSIFGVLGYSVCVGFYLYRVLSARERDYLRSLGV